MILAAADFADEQYKKTADRKVSPPRELLLAWQYNRYGFTRPIAELPAGLLKRMTSCVGVYNAITERNYYVLTQKKTDADFRKNFPELAATYREIKELRESYDPKNSI